MKPKRVPPGWIEVVRAQRPWVGMRRLTFAGPRLSHFPSQCGGFHIKLFLPRAPQHRFELPTLNESGEPLWPANEHKPVSRTYSVRSFDPERQELDVEFVLHEHAGPASAWAAAARPGQRIGIAGPAAPPALLQVATFNLFAGDRSALPALCARVEALPPASVAHVLLSLPAAFGEVTLQSAAEVRLQRVGDHPGELARAVQRVPWPSRRAVGQCFAWVAGESEEVVSARKYLREELRLPQAQMYTVPYWKAVQSEEEYHAERHRIMDAMEES